jgi:hypothetical protein
LGFDFDACSKINISPRVPPFEKNTLQVNSYQMPQTPRSKFSHFDLCFLLFTLSRKIKYLFSFQKTGDNSLESHVLSHK